MGRGAEKNPPSHLGGSAINESKGVPGLFGAPLEKALKGQPVPPFMKQCFDYIREKGTPVPPPNTLLSAPFN